jgi:uncharacterized membrane protein
MASTLRDRRHNPDEATDKAQQNPEGSGDRKSGARQGRTQAHSRAARVKSAHIITERIDVGVPAQVAFDQWTQFDKWSEMFKKESADTGRRNRHGGKGNSPQGEVKVRSKIGPSERQFTAAVMEVEPGRRITWKSKGQVQAMGTTSFHRLDDRLTRLMVEIEYRPTGFLEVIGNFFRMQRRRVRRDLRLFKHYIEMRGKATGTGPRQAAGEGLGAEVDGQEES